MLVRLTGANPMQTAPEDRVQQDRGDGKKFAQRVHAPIPLFDGIGIIGIIPPMVKEKSCATRSWALARFLTRMIH